MVTPMQFRSDNILVFNCEHFALVGQAGLEPATALSTDFTDRGDTNYTVLTHI